LFPNVVFVYAAEPSGMKWFKEEILSKDSFNGFDVSGKLAHTTEQYV
jgi:hypothetical protein